MQIELTIVNIFLPSFPGSPRGGRTRRGNTERGCKGNSTGYGIIKTTRERGFGKLLGGGRKGTIAERRTRHMQKNILVIEPLCGGKSSAQRIAELEGIPEITEGELRLRKTPQGKPYLENSPFCVSISHSGEFWICVLSEREVGVDIERNRVCRYEKIAARFFSSEEQQAVASKGREMFFRIWAAKESRVKYTGEGLSSLRTFSCIDKGRFRKEIGGIPLLAGLWSGEYGFALCGGALETEVWSRKTAGGKILLQGDLQEMLSTADPK